MKFSMPLGKSLPQIIFPSIFFFKWYSCPHTHTHTHAKHTHTHTHTHTPEEKGEATVKVYLNRDTILQGSFKTVKLLFTKS